MGKVTIENILAAYHTVKEAAVQTPLQRNAILSDRYQCNVYLKREDLQVVRSFKIRGAYYLMKSLSDEQLARGVVCASAGNHAQGVAFSCKALGVTGNIFMPSTTPRQKITQVKLFGGPFVEVILTGDTFDDALSEALKYCEDHSKVFIHPFDDAKVIAGQGTVAVEILNEIKVPVDYLFTSIGGGGLASGVGTYIKAVSPHTSMIGVEPQGAPSMKQSSERQEIVVLDNMDKFVDGAAVRRVGEITFDICNQVIDEYVLVPEGKVCTSILELYNENAIVAEPAGALPIAALDAYSERIIGKNVVCIVSGGNNDIERMQEIKERSLIYEGMKHYFTINFPQRAGALREFLDEVLGPTDDIARFEYTKKNSRENGPALVGIELKHKDDYEPLIDRMVKKGVQFAEINKDPYLFHLLI